MPLRDDLLNPISADNPAGQNLRYDPLYDKIKEARREESDAPQGEWKIEVKQADWLLTIRLTSDALATKTKDLQLAVWLAQALLCREGIASFRDALDFICKLLETFWDNLYPEIEDGDLELRKAPLEWLGSESDREPNRPASTAIKRVPITKGGLTWVHFEETRQVGSEEAADSYDKQQARARKIEEGKTPPEVFDKDFEATPKAFYADLEKTFDATIASLSQLEQLSDEKFGEESPSYRTLHNVLVEVRQTVHVLLLRKREKEPDPDEPAEAVPHEAGAGSAGTSPSGSLGPPAPLPGSWDDAVSRVVVAAKFMRQQDPSNPAPYLMLRALRWGELRSSGSKLDVAKLAAPSAEIRQTLKRAAHNSSWAELLETAETAMGMECGRGWLDLQRYTVRACQELGGYYEPVRRAIVVELAGLLAIYPQLPELTLMDDLPTANAETQAWIQKKVLTRAASAGEEAWAGVEALRQRPIEKAMQAAQAGHPEVCMALLTREIGEEPSGRGKFQRRVQLARLCQATGNHTIAITLLQEAMSEIENKRLEEWESREMLSFPLLLIYESLVKSGDSSGERERVYSWICRLDPFEALKLEK